MKVALVTSSMPLAPWQNGITGAFAEAGLAAEVIPWEGRQPRSAIGARYALVWLPPAQLFEVEHDLEACSISVPEWTGAVALHQRLAATV